MTTSSSDDLFFLDDIEEDVSFSLDGSFKLEDSGSFRLSEETPRDAKAAKQPPPQPAPTKTQPVIKPLKLPTTEQPSAAAPPVAAAPPPPAPAAAKAVAPPKQAGAVRPQSPNSSVDSDVDITKLKIGGLMDRDAENDFFVEDDTIEGREETRRDKLFNREERHRTAQLEYLGSWLNTAAEEQHARRGAVGGFEALARDDLAWKALRTDKAYLAATVLFTSYNAQKQDFAAMSFTQVCLASKEDAANTFQAEHARYLEGLRVEESWGRSTVRYQQQESHVRRRITAAEEGHFINLQLQVLQLVEYDQRIGIRNLQQAVRRSAVHTTTVEAETKRIYCTFVDYAVTTITTELFRTEALLREAMEDQHRHFMERCLVESMEVKKRMLVAIVEDSARAKVNQLYAIDNPFHRGYTTIRVEEALAWIPFELSTEKMLMCEEAENRLVEMWRESRRALMVRREEVARASIVRSCHWDTRHTFATALDTFDEVFRGNVSDEAMEAWDAAFFHPMRLTKLMVKEHNRREAIVQEQLDKRARYAFGLVEMRARFQGVAREERYDRRGLLTTEYEIVSALQEEINERHYLTVLALTLFEKVRLEGLHRHTRHSLLQLHHSEAEEMAARQERVLDQGYAFDALCNAFRDNLELFAEEAYHRRALWVEAAECTARWGIEATEGMWYDSGLLNMDDRLATCYVYALDTADIRHEEDREWLALSEHERRDAVLADYHTESVALHKDIVNFECFDLHLRSRLLQEESDAWAMVSTVVCSLEERLGRNAATLHEAEEYLLVQCLHAAYLLVIFEGLARDAIVDAFEASAAHCEDAFFQRVELEERARVELSWQAGWHTLWQRGQRIHFCAKEEDDRDGWVCKFEGYFRDGELAPYHAQVVLLQEEEAARLDIEADYAVLHDLDHTWQHQYAHVFVEEYVGRQVFLQQELAAVQGIEVYFQQLMVLAREHHDRRWAQQQCYAKVVALLEYEARSQLRHEMNQERRTTLAPTGASLFLLHRWEGIACDTRAEEDEAFDGLEQAWWLELEERRRTITECEYDAFVAGDAAPRLARLAVEHEHSVALAALDTDYDAELHSFRSAWNRSLLCVDESEDRCLEASLEAKEWTRHAHIWKHDLLEQIVADTRDVAARDEAAARARLWVHLATVECVGEERADRAQLRAVQRRAWLGLSALVLAAEEEVTRGDLFRYHSQCLAEAVLERTDTLHLYQLDTDCLASRARVEAAEDEQRDTLRRRFQQRTAALTRLEWCLNTLEGMVGNEEKPSRARLVEAEATARAELHRQSGVDHARALCASACLAEARARWTAVLLEQTVLWEEMHRAWLLCWLDANHKRVLSSPKSWVMLHNIAPFVKVPVRRFGALAPSPAAAVVALHYKHVPIVRRAPTHRPSNVPLYTLEYSRKVFREGRDALRAKRVHERRSFQVFDKVIKQTAAIATIQRTGRGALSRVRTYHRKLAWQAATRTVNCFLAIAAAKFLKHKRRREAEQRMLLEDQAERTVLRLASTPLLQAQLRALLSATAVEGRRRGHHLACAATLRTWCGAILPHRAALQRRLQRRERRQRRQEDQELRHHSATAVQTWFRMARQRRCFLAELALTAEARAAAKEHKRSLQLIVRTQAAVRRYLAIAVFDTLRKRRAMSNQKALSRETRTCAARTIQKVFRGYQVRVWRAGMLRARVVKATHRATETVVDIPTAAPAPPPVFYPGLLGLKRLCAHGEGMASVSTYLHEDEVRPSWIMKQRSNRSMAETTQRAIPAPAPMVEPTATVMHVTPRGFHASMHAEGEEVAASAASTVRSATPSASPQDAAAYDGALGVDQIVFDASIDPSQDPPASSRSPPAATPPSVPSLPLASESAPMRPGPQKLTPVGQRRPKSSPRAVSTLYRHVRPKQDARFLHSAEHQREVESLRRMDGDALMAHVAKATGLPAHIIAELDANVRIVVEDEARVARRDQRLKDNRPSKALVKPLSPRTGGKPKAHSPSRMTRKAEALRRFQYTANYATPKQARQVPTPTCEAFHSSSVHKPLSQFPM